KISAAGTKYEAKVKAIQDKIASGALSGIPETPTK
ncbi:MAG: hypothetical protein QOF17_305, partial [Solirubrobacteraceae bacterium]|nr:hypothetical protein [Solirubrobacteraceae bacterium]